MSIVVEHEKRRKEILEKALDVFVDEGFENATFQKIADRCSITRTTLYIYFNNKREIFSYSIKLLQLKSEENICQIMADKLTGYTEKLTKIMLDVLQLLEKNSRISLVILDYLLHISKSKADPEKRVRRRTVKLRRILSSLVMDGIKAGEFKPINIKTIDDFLYSFIETAIFRLVVLKQEALTDLRKTVTFAVKQLAASN